MNNFKDFSRIKNSDFYGNFQKVGWNEKFEARSEDINVPSIDEVDKNTPFDSDLLKVEYLITRECNLACHYCTMPAVVLKRLELSQERKKIIAHCMKVLKIPFTAIYGSEPTMLPVEELGSTIKEFEDCGIFTTIITNGIKISDGYLDRLNSEYKLQSLTMSCDDLNAVNINDPYTRAKSNRTFQWAPYWQKNFVDKGLARDTQITITVHKKNFKVLPEFIRYWSDLGIWISIDWLHVWRGQEGSKVTDDSNANEFMFKEEDHKDVMEVMDKVLSMKEQGHKIWNSKHLLMMFKNMKPNNYSWRCKPTSFLTVDTNGEVFFCDDFQPRSYGDRMYIWDILTPENLQKMKDRNTRWMDKSCYADSCSGCRWATHIEAENVIKHKKVSLSHYVHGK